MHTHTRRRSEGATASTALHKAHTTPQRSAMASAAPKKRKAKAPPPAGYVCKLCKQPGHWVYECAQCVKKPKVAKAPPKPNPCVSTEEARIKCHCGLRAMKRRSWKADQAAPEQRWVCARLKKHKIKRGDQNLKPCKFNVAVATAACPLQHHQRRSA